MCMTIIYLVFFVQWIMVPGEIFLHCLPSGKSCFDDPPSISESWGGRLTDYRIAVSYYKTLIIGLITMFKHLLVVHCGAVELC